MLVLLVLSLYYSAVCSSPVAVIALQHRNLDRLEAIIADVSNPRSPSYQRFVTPEQLRGLTAPPDWVVEAVVNDLKGQHATATVEVAWDRAHVFVKGVTGPIQVSPHLRKHVATVAGAWNALKGVKPRSSLPFPGMLVTPQVLFERYGQPNPPPIYSDALQSCAEFEQAYFYPSDVTKFQGIFNLSANPIAKVVGPNHPQSGYIGEASLDTQYLTINKVTTWVFSIGSPGMDLLSWYLNVTSFGDAAPKVHSISWGGGESGYDASHMQAVNVAFSKLAALGHTVFVSSGDEGAGHSGLFCGHFDPTFPASCPYVTSVGGTYAVSSTSAEQAWDYSGGGFSNTFPRASWQADAIQAYLNSTAKLPKQSLWNSTGRGLPDVSALSTNYALCGVGYCNGTLSGTSASAPFWAQMWSLVIGATGKGRGFINPLLYSLRNTAAFKTPAGGCNKGCFGESAFCVNNAGAGWSAVTGLGTPVFKNLVDLVKEK